MKSTDKWRSVIALEDNPLGRDIVVSETGGTPEDIYQLINDLQFNPEVDRMICLGGTTLLSEEDKDGLIGEPWFFSVLNKADLTVVNQLKPSDVPPLIIEFNCDGSLFIASNALVHPPVSDFNVLGDELVNYNDSAADIIFSTGKVDSYQLTGTQCLISSINPISAVAGRLIEFSEK